MIKGRRVQFGNGRIRFHHTYRINQERGYKSLPDLPFIEPRPQAVRPQANSDNGVVAVYVDGALIGSDSFSSGALAAAGTFALGQRISGFDQNSDPVCTAGQVFQGTIYEVRVYDDVRTHEQILIDMVMPLDANNLPDRLVNGRQFLFIGSQFTGTDIKGIT